MNNRQNCEQNTIDGSDLRVAQLRMLELLKFLDRFCKEHNLTYWLDSGTLLGAARHGGFIPWDDDADVVMPLEDAKKLKALMGKELHEDFIILQSHDTDNNYIRSSWLTLRDIKSEYIQNSGMHNRLKYKGFQVDIFIDRIGVPQWTKKLTSVFFHQLIQRPLMSDNVKFLRPFVNANHFILDNLMIPVLSMFKNNSPYLTNFLGNPFDEKHHSDNIFPISKIEFEGYMFNAPANPSEYLKETYGDWEKIPDADKIQTHNATFRFL